jgi:hypothetical protein
LKRRLSIVLTFVLLFTLAPSYYVTYVEAADSYGARAQFGGENNTELFLGGKYIELGISNWGDLGTVGNKPMGFRGTSARNTIGMSADHDGFGVGHDLPIDYYLPGTPEERFTVGFKAVGKAREANSNSAQMSAKNMPTTVTNESDVSKGLLQARIVSTWTGKMEITQVISFHENNKFYRNDVTIKNINDSNWDSARYMRTMDPDNTVDQGGSYSTDNVVLHTYATDGFAVVQAQTSSDDDRLYQAFGTRAPIFYYSNDPAAKASIFGFSNADPYEQLAYDSARQKGVPQNGDVGITLTWDSGPLAVNQSKSFTYYTSLDDRPFEEVLLEIEPNKGVIETDANDGTVSGKQRIVVKGSKLAATIDPAKVQVNNLLPGITYTVKRVSDTLLELDFAGVSTNHNSEHSIHNASVTLEKDQVVGGTIDYTSEPFNVTFYDPARAYIASASVTEDVYGSFGADDFVTIKIENAKFNETVVKSDITIPNLLAGMDYTVTRVSDTELRMDITGTPTSPVDVDNASVQVASHALIGSSTAIVTNTFKIDVGAKEPHLFIESPLNNESDANDGSLSSEIIVNLVNGTFADPVVTEAVYGIHLPPGLSIGSVERVNDTQLKVTIAGNATSSDAANSVYNTQITIDKNLVIPNDTHVTTSGVFSNTFNLLFDDARQTLKVGSTTIHDNMDGTVTETLTVTLENGTFVADLTGAVGLNNMPEGLTYSVERISDTELRVSFTGVPTGLNPASAFASVTVDAGFVNGAVDQLTSDAFALKAPSDLTIVTKDAAGITWDAIKNANALQSAVRTNLTIPTSKRDNGSRISWTTSHSSVNSASGVVNRPATTAADVEVTLTASITFGSETITKPFIVTVKKSVSPLALTNVAVDDAIPNQATLTFNQDLKSDLTLADFAGLTIAGKTVTAVTIDGDKAIVTLSDSVAPNEALTVVYDTTQGNLLAAESDGATNNELNGITAGNQTGFTTNNNVVQLEIVAAHVSGGKLKLVFNKPVDQASLDLSGLKYDGAAVSGTSVLNGNELVVTLPVGYASNILTFDSGTIRDSSNPNNTLSAILTGIDLGAAQSYIDSSGKLTDNTLGFVNGGSHVVLSPAFEQNKSGGYIATVNNAVNSVQLNAIPTSAAGTIVKVSVNGTEVDIANGEALALQVGANVIKVGIYDQNNPNILLGQYEISINRETSSSNSDTGRPTTVIEIDVVIGGDQQADITKVSINRTTNQDGTITDQVTYTSDKALETVNKAKESGVSIARIVIPDKEDQVSEVKVDIPLATAKMLLDNGIDLEIYTENAIIRLPQSSLEGLEGDFYFHLVPVKDEDERNEIEERARIEQVVREVSGDNRIEIVARPMTIETNLPSRLVTLTLPLKNVEIPVNAVERAAFLAQLGIFIEHSDGEKKVAIPEVVTLPDGTMGLQFSINKFSTFTIFNFNNADFGQHQAYITGFPDGQFKPEASVTRGQIALMMARNLGYNISTIVNSVPFEDVATNHYAAGAIAFVNKAEVMLGDPNGHFRANDTITRAEMAALVKSYHNLAVKQGGKLSFSDTAGHWAQYIIEASHAAGTLDGYSDGSFRPNANLTRAEAVMVINKLLKRGPLNGVNSPSFADVRNDHWAFGHIEEASQNHAYLIDQHQNEHVILE